MNKFIVMPINDSSFLLKEAHNYLNLTSLQAVKQYDVFEANEEADLDLILPLFEEAVVVDSLADYQTDTSFRYRQVLGQYDEKEEMANRIVQKIKGHDIDLHHSVILDLQGLDAAAMESFKAYYVNETEIEVVPFEALDFDMGISAAKDLQVVEGFTEFSDIQLEDLIADYSMDMADIRVVQAYFQEEAVDPTIFQLKVIDTYWSDHCRHTTFLTELSQMTVEEGKYQEVIEQTIADYNQVRDELNRTKKITLMDLGTINAKYAKHLGLLDNLDESDEVNACTVKIKVDVDGQEEDYLLFFKNETHNHPTEIEPFGGAATCIGGGIRDPLSGRAYVHQAMRITGAKNPNTPYEETRAGKLPQRVISQRAAKGYSDYGNQIGQSAGYVEEFYHEGFEAKRMELGALVGAAPIDNVVRLNPVAGDAIILLGGRTGRDGLGAAVGSSMVQTEKSIELQGAEVQKGNPTIERKIIRLFRNGEATRLIKKSNDFGAGGVSVAIGELADGLVIDLDKVPTKYPGMDPCEIALSESQERMAVVVAPEDVTRFIELAEAEDIEASLVAEVTDSPYMIMRYDGEEVLRLKRDFIDSNGGAKVAEAHIVSEDIADFYNEKRDIKAQLADIQNASQRALGQQFDWTIGKGTVLAPFGGQNRITTQEGMVAKIPVLDGETQTVSVMTVAYKPALASVSPYHGAYYAVVNSIAKIVALGVPYQDARLTFQEFFERLTDNVKWGKPTGALLGAFNAMKQLGLAAIGGKDSMSGTFEELTVPPTLISFAVAPTTLDKVNSRELKATDSKVVLVEVATNADDLIDQADLVASFEAIKALIDGGAVRAISTLGDKTVEANLVEMALGNGIGFEMDPAFLNKQAPLAFLVEVAADFETSYPVVAHTNGSSVAQLDEAYNLSDLMVAYTEPLADAFDQIDLVDLEEVKPALEVPELSSEARVLIPVMTGVNGEYDLYQAFKRHTDHVDFFIIKEDLAYAESVAELAGVLADYDVLAFPDGSILSNRIAYGQAVELLIADLQEELEAFIQDKYILAIGASFAGFVRSGLIEFGKVQAGTSIGFKTNPYEKFVAEVVPVNVVGESDFAAEGSYSTALASYTLIMDLDEEKFQSQILAKYARFFEGESAVDAMTDPSGHILGVHANFERFNTDGFKNIQSNEAPYIANLLKKVGK